MYAPSSNLLFHRVNTPFFDPHHHYALSQIRQTGLVTDYYLQFDSVSSHVICMTEVAHLDRFISGLREDIRHELMMLRPNYMFQALQLALQIEAKILTHQVAVPSSVPPVKSDNFSGSPIVISQELVDKTNDVSVATTIFNIPTIDEQSKDRVWVSHRSLNQPTYEPIADESLFTIVHTTGFAVSSDLSVSATNENLLDLTADDKVQEATSRHDPPPIPQLLSHDVPPCISDHIAAFSINSVCDFGIDTSDVARSWAPSVSVLTKLHPTTMALPLPPPPSFPCEPGHNTNVVVEKAERQAVNDMFAAKSTVGSSTHHGGHNFVFDPSGPLMVNFPPSCVTFSKMEISVDSHPSMSRAPLSMKFSSSSSFSGVSPTMAPLFVVPPSLGPASGWPCVPWMWSLEPHRVTLGLAAATSFPIIFCLILLLACF